MSRSSKVIGCLACGNDVQVDAGVSTAICGSCMQKIAGPAALPAVARGPIVKTPKLTKAGVPRKRRGEGKPYQPSGFPRGWHFKLYYKHTDGKEYSRGKLITDAKEIRRAQEKQAQRDKAKV